SARLRPRSPRSCRATCPRVRRRPRSRGGTRRACPRTEKSHFATRHLTACWHNSSMLSKLRVWRAGSATTQGTSLGLNRRQAIPVAVASIAGSGILFLPSAVVATAGPDCLVVWVVAIAMCVPMLLMFDDVVRAHPDSDGIEAFVRAGLGNRVARAVPFLFAAIVAVGLPGGAMVVGHFV